PFRGGVPRRFAIASAVATDRIPAVRLDYATLLYDRKVYYGWVEWTNVWAAGIVLVTELIVYDRSHV
ncbi:MAG TPA: hypothetical protein VIH54_19385, partial [Chthoniobacterales bacterium]